MYIMVISFGDWLVALGSTKFGKRRAGAAARAAKKSVLEMENGLVSLPAKLCFVCGRLVN